MSSSENNRRNKRFRGAIVLGAILAAAAFQMLALRALAAEKKKGIDVEIPYEATVLKTSLTSPLYLNEASGGMVVSDGAGGVYAVTLAGKSTELVGKSKLKHPAGVAVAPSGFGTAGQVYVLPREMIREAPARSMRLTSPVVSAPLQNCPMPAAANPPSVATLNSAQKALPTRASCTPLPAGTPRFTRSTPRARPPSSVPTTSPTRGI